MDHESLRGFPQMKNVIFSVVLAASALLPVACSPKQEGGGTAAEDKFTLKAASGSETLKQGEKKNMDVTITRGKKFDHEVELKATAADDSKLTVTIEPTTIKKGDTTTKATLIVEAAKDAPLKESTVTITATPAGGGKVAPVDIKVTVKKE
jgi:polyisoprenoid-binding protein YceI